jgi:hypothetical protein
VLTDQTMADMFVMCPECGLRAKLTRSDARVVDAEGECKHWINPANCPTLAELPTAIQHVLKQSVRPVQSGGTPNETD